VLELADGKTVEGDFVVVSAGIKPNIELAQAAGISVNKGILINDHMETNISNIYAAGDVAEYKDKMYGIWPAAQRQGVVAGINMAGGGEAYTGTVPATTLKVAGIHLTSMGNISGEDKNVEQVKEKDPGRSVYKKLFMKEGKVIGAIFLGEGKNAYDMGKLIEKKIDVSGYKEKLLKPDFDVKNLLK
jgi:nitrite reductase (NADH) large subunit